MQLNVAASVELEEMLLNRLRSAESPSCSDQAQHKTRRTVYNICMETAAQLAAQIQSKPGQMSHTARPAHRWVHVGRQCAASLHWCGTDRRWISRHTALAAARSCSTTPRSSRSSRRRDRPRARSSCRSDPFALSFSLRPSLHALGCATAVGAIIADDAARARLGSTGCVEQREAA